MSAIRKIKRNIAHKALRDRGFVHVNKKGYTNDGRSFFASVWRDYVTNK